MWEEKARETRLRCMEERAADRKREREERTADRKQRRAERDKELQEERNKRRPEVEEYPAVGKASLQPFGSAIAYQISRQTK
jgi:hypothetical protein